MSPLDLERLAVRIEELEHTSTRDWHPADAMQFKRGLYDPYVRVVDRRLPAAEDVRKMAKALRQGETITFTVQNYQDAIRLCLDLESLAHRNRRGSPHRMMQDIIHGRVPFGR